MGTPFLGAEELILLGVTESDAADALGAAQGRGAPPRVVAPTPSDPDTTVTAG